MDPREGKEQFVFFFSREDMKIKKRRDHKGKKDTKILSWCKTKPTRVHAEGFVGYMHVFL